MCDAKKANRRVLFILGLGLALALLTGTTGALAETDPVDHTADRNGIPVIRLTIDPEELQKVNNSADHSYRAREGMIRIEIPRGYEGKFGEIDPETTAVDLPLEYIRGRGNSTWLEERKPYKFKLKSKADILESLGDRHRLTHSHGRSVR